MCRRYILCMVNISLVNAKLGILTVTIRFVERRTTHVVEVPTGSVQCLIRLGNVSDMWWRYFARHSHVRASRPVLSELTWLAGAAPIIKHLPLSENQYLFKRKVCTLTCCFCLSTWIILYPHDIISVHAIRRANTWNVAVERCANVWRARDDSATIR